MDVVYIYKRVERAEELRYSIRALEANFPDHGPLWIIGDRPDGLREDAYRYIPHPAAPRRSPVYREHEWPDYARIRAKEVNINQKLELIANHSPISDEYLLMNDDYYIMRPVTASILCAQVYTRGDSNTAEYAEHLEKHYPGRRPYRRLLQETLERVREAGLHGWDFEAHIPFVFSRARSRELIARFRDGNAPLPWTWATLYHNTFFRETPHKIWMNREIEERNRQGDDYRKLEVRGVKSRRWIQRRLGEKTLFMNHNWSGFQRAYVALLQERFPTPSRYEVPAPMSRPARDDRALTGLDDLQTKVHLFWTGGFDSTFRILQLLDDGVDVQPIYISQKIDVRKNHAFEFAAMMQLSEVIRRRFQDASLHDLLVVDEVPENSWVSRCASTIRYGTSHKTPMGAQYVSLCRFAEAHHAPIEISIEIGGRAERLLRNYVTGEDGACRLDPDRLRTEKEQALMIFHRLRFPLIHLMKSDMMDEAEQRGFLEILSQTWTCWFPRKGRPCGRCKMCRSRPEMLSG